MQKFTLTLIMLLSLALITACVGSKSSSSSQRKQVTVNEFVGAALEGRGEPMIYYLHQGGDINAKNHLGDTALMMASAMQRHDTMQFLIDEGARVNEVSTGKLGFTALHYAVASSERRSSPDNKTGGIALLLNNGADVNYRNKAGETALGVAISKQLSPEIIDYLKNHGAVE